MKQTSFLQPGTKQTLRRLLSHPLTPFVTLWAILLCCHLTFFMVPDDADYFGSIVGTQSLWDFSAYHYQTWSSRQLLELAECWFGYFPALVWKLLNPVVAVAGAYCIAYALRCEKNAQANWVLCGFILLYPWENLREAGWISTTLVYLWPAVFGLIALLPVMQLLRGKTPPVWLCVLSFVPLLYAANMEQTLVFLLFSLGCLLLWFLVQRRLHWVVIAQLAVCLASLVYMLTCPGNEARIVNESVSYFKNFPMLSLLSKLEMGLSLTLRSVIYRRDYIFFFFTLLLALVIFSRYKQWFVRLMGVAPFVLVMVLGTYQRLFVKLVPQLQFFTESYTGQGIVNLSNCNILTAYLPLLVLYGTFALCIVDVYLAFGHTPKALACILALGIGLGTRVAIGLSPTIGISGGRTGLFFSLVTLTVCVALYEELPPKSKLKWLFVPLFIAYCLLQIYSIAEM